VIAQVIEMFIIVLSLAIIARALLSWFPNIDPRNPAVELLVGITEPILAPIRSVMPRIGMIDLTPMIAIILLNVVGRIIVSSLST
jgi:YggT family protein